MPCHVVSSKRQTWEQSRFQEQMSSPAVGRGLQTQPALSWVPRQSNSPPPGWDLTRHPSLVLTAGGSGGSMGSRSAVHTSFQSLTSHKLITGTTITVVGVTWRESTARGLLASLHSLLTPSSHLCLMLSLLWTTEVHMHVLGQFYLAEPSGS